MSAPTIGESPTTAVARLAPITTRRLAARNSSGLLVRAACANRRGRAMRPTTSRTSTTRPPCHSVSTRPSQPSACALGAIAPSMKMIGTMAMSSNSSIESAARPTGVCVPEIGNTIAVEERAKASPRPIAPVQYWPIIDSAIARLVPMITSSSAPSPKTSFRICHNRLNESSRPIENSSRMIPNSANGSRLSGSLIVMCPSHGYSKTNLPRPNGPTSTPIRMNPMTGVTRKRVKTGITIPAAPRMTSASVSAGEGAISPAMDCT